MEIFLKSTKRTTWNCPRIDGLCNLKFQECKKPRKKWDTLPTSTGEFIGFLPSTVSLPYIKSLKISSHCGNRSNLASEVIVLVWTCGVPKALPRCGTITGWTGLELDGEVVKRLCLKRSFFFGLSTEKLNAMLVCICYIFPFLS